MRPVTTRLSSKGQVVIPASVRAELGLAAGDLLTVEVEAANPPRMVLRRPDLAEVLRRLEVGYAWLERNDVDLVEEFHQARRRARDDERRQGSR